MWTRKAAELIKLVTYCNNVNALLIMHTSTSTYTKKNKKNFFLKVRFPFIYRPRMLVIRKRMPLTPSSTIWHRRPKGGDTQRLERSDFAMARVTD